MRWLFGALLVILFYLEYKVSDQPRCTRAWNNVRTCDVFSKSYIQAQSRFHNVATSFCDVQSIEILPGYDMDLCLIEGNQPGIVVHVSGTHGIEGFAGSAIQIGLLVDGLPSKHPTILLVHAFNPYGMAHYRRCNENNVDLNRNGLMDDEWTEFTDPHWNKDMFESFRELFYPPPPVGFWKTKVLSWWSAAYYAVKFGIPNLKTAMVGGQYHDPKGIFYGGDRTQASLEKLLDYLQKLDIISNRNEAVTWIDVHTGLGTLGEDTLMPSTVAPIDKAEIRNYFPDCHYADDKNAKTVNQGYENVKGLAIDYFYQKLLEINPRHLFVNQEFGTRPLPMVGNSMVIENAAYHDDSLSEAQKLAWAKTTTKAAFYPSSETWRVRVLERGIRRIHQAMQRSIEKSQDTAISGDESMQREKGESLDRSEL